MATFLLRRAALRALASSSQLARNQGTVSNSSCLVKPTSSVAVYSAKVSPFATPFRRAYATEQRDLDEEPRSNAQQKTFGSPTETTAESNRTGQSTIAAAAQSVSETAGRARDAVASAVSSGIDSITPGRSERGGRGDRGDRGESRGVRPNTPESNSLYVGNLYFEVTEAGLRREFSKFGTIMSVKIIYDGRGLSKGFGYIEFADQSAAVEARTALDGQVFEGRRLAVQYAIKSSDRPRTSPNSEGYTNTPSKTLFIGNMSYEMSDKDLNDLFRGIKGVLDVRVAIDRRTGQPRGFAHADFIDIKSAEDAATFLKAKEFYGRNLRIDFSTSTPTRKEVPAQERD